MWHKNILEIPTYTLILPAFGALLRSQFLVDIYFSIFEHLFLMYHKISFLCFGDSTFMGFSVLIHLHVLDFSTFTFALIRVAGLIHTGYLWNLNDKTSFLIFYFHFLKRTMMFQYVVDGMIILICSVRFTRPRSCSPFDFKILKLGIYQLISLNGAVNGFIFSFKFHYEPCTWLAF